METLSCHGRVYHCSTDAVVDPDVAGPGVVASFLATACMAFMVIIVGYITDALPDERLNRVDRLVIQKIQALLRLRAISHPPFDPVEKRRKEIRKESLQRFVLTLSDQQLVTGLAICVAGWAKCDISTYSFSIVSALAWFSCTTHLSTLTVLHDYFQRHPRLRWWRVIGMSLSVVALLAVQLANFNGHLNDTSLFYCALARGFHLELFDRRFDFNRLMVVFVWLGYAFGNRLVGLYCQDQTVYTTSWFYRHVMSLLGQPVDAVPMQEHVAEAMQKIRERSQQPPSFRRKFGSWGLRHDTFFDDFASSFLWEMSALMFSLTYGFAHIVAVREQLGQEYTGNAHAQGLNVLGFGQIVAVMLVLLPVLMAGEMHQELQRKHRWYEKTAGSRSPQNHGSWATLVDPEADENNPQHTRMSTDFHRVQSISLPALPSMTAKGPWHAKEWALQAAGRLPDSDDAKLEAGWEPSWTHMHPYSSALTQTRTATTTQTVESITPPPARQAVGKENDAYRTKRGRYHLLYIIVNHFIGMLAAAVVLSIVLPNRQALYFLYMQLFMMFFRPIYLSLAEAREISLALVQFAWRRCRVRVSPTLGA